jgi:hypothetical protein
MDIALHFRFLVSRMIDRDDILMVEMNVDTDMPLPCRWSAIEFRTANENKLNVSESTKYSRFSVMILQARIGCEDRGYRGEEHGDWMGVVLDPIG